MIENKIQKLTELINSSMNGAKKDYAFNLINSIIDELNFNEAQIKMFKSKSVNIENSLFDTFFEKCVFCLQAIGFDKTDLVNYDDQALIFLAKNKHKFKNPLTIDYFNTMHQLIRYYEWMNNKMPENLTDLKHAYTEIENNRMSEL